MKSCVPLIIDVDLGLSFHCGEGLEVLGIFP